MEPIPVGRRVAWKGTHGSRTGRVVIEPALLASSETVDPSRLLVVLAEDTGAEVRVARNRLVPMVDEHPQKVRPLTDAAEGQST